MENLLSVEIKQYKEIKASLYLKLFNHQIKPWLPKDCVIYWGMGVCGIELKSENSEEEERLLTATEETVQKFFDLMGMRIDESWNNTLTYQFFSGLDLVTNTQDKKKYDCDRIEMWKL